MTEEMTQDIVKMDIMQIMELLPHRYPFLLVDRITECIPGKYSKGYKNLTMNEAFFQGHFPNNPIMPGVLQLEALAQCSAPVLLSLPENKGKLALYAGVDGVRFKNIVRPGDRLDMEAEIISFKRGLCKGKVQGFVDGVLACELESTIIIPDVFNQFKPKKQED